MSNIEKLFSHGTTLRIKLLNFNRSSYSTGNAHMDGAIRETTEDMKSRSTLL